MKKAGATPKPQKRARIEESDNLVTEINAANPVVNLKEVDTIDYEKHSAAWRRKEVQERLDKAQLNPEVTGRRSNNQQAFTVWNMPVTLDTKMLSLKELKAELSIRGVSTQGTKQLLVQRLDYHIREKEPRRVKE